MGEPVTDGLALSLTPPGPGEPRERFVRGDANSDGSINLADGIAILNCLFRDGVSPACMDAADADDDGGDMPTLTDAIRIFNWLFLGGPAPAPPTPQSATFGAQDCGVDTTGDGMNCSTSPGPCTP